MTRLQNLKDGLMKLIKKERKSCDRKLEKKLKNFFKKVVDFSKITCYNDYVIGIWQRILNGYDGLV